DPNADFAPIWLGNSETIIFESIRDGAWALYRQKISERDAELIMTFPEEQPFPNWASPDGRELLLTLIRGEISDIYKLTIEPEPALQPVLNTPFREEEATLSPGMDWIAYASNETGRMEIYIQSYPVLGRRQQVSLGGGRLPKWSPNGDR